MCACKDVSVYAFAQTDLLLPLVPLQKCTQPQIKLRGWQLEGVAALICIWVVV